MLISTRAEPAHQLAGFGFQLAVNPALGGRIDRLDFQGEPVLRPTQDTRDTEPLNCSCFPLVPFSNRIRNRTFSYRGEDFRLPSNWTGDGNAIHGEGWKRPWTVEHQSKTRIDMSLSGAEFWPWDYCANQSIILTESGIEFRISLTNTSNAIMLAGIGLHPYFSRDADTRLTLRAGRCWAPMSTPPMQSVEPHSLENEAVADLDLDHCFEGWDGHVRIEHPTRGIAINVDALENAPHAVIYTPPDETYFCLEPVTQITGAFEFPTGAPQAATQLLPDQTLSLAFRISVSDL